MTAPTVKKTPPPAKPAQNTVPSALKDKYPGRRLNNIFIKGLDGRSMTLRDIPLQMTASDFLEYAASEKGIDAMSMRLIFDGKQLHHRKFSLSYFSSPYVDIRSRRRRITDGFWNSRSKLNILSLTEHLLTRKKNSELRLVDRLRGG